MVWIKRNIIFVVSAAVGVILMGCAGYFLYSGISENAKSSEELNAAVSELKNLQSKTPFPSKENIQEAKEQQQQIKDFLSEIKSSFATFPAPAKTDEKGFKSLLDKSIAQLQEAATNAGVGLPVQYAFSFSGITTKLNFPIQNIEPWTVQLQEIQSLCSVLFHAKINFLEKIRRVPIGADDQGGADYLTATSTTNQTCNHTPYEITFRGFSGEIAAVLDGLQRSTNCYVVKNIDVQPSSSSASTEVQAGSVEPIAVPAYGVHPGRAFQPGTTPSGSPLTILSEKSLRVTLLVDVIKLNSP